MSLPFAKVGIPLNNVHSHCPKNTSSQSSDWNIVYKFCLKKKILEYNFCHSRRTAIREWLQCNYLKIEYTTNTQLQNPLNCLSWFVCNLFWKWKDAFHCTVAVKDNHLGQSDNILWKKLRPTILSFVLFAGMHPASLYAAFLFFTFCCDC